LNDPIVVAGLTVQPGEKRLGLLTIPEFFADGQSIEIPFTVLHGKEKGKTLYVQVAQHGSEVMGLEAIRRLMSGLDPALMEGTLIYCLPNPLAFREKTRATVFDPKPGGMNRVWPGDPDGSLTERMAHMIWTELVSHADEVVDLHTAGRGAPVWVFYEADGVSELAPRETALRSEEMAYLFGAPILYIEAEAYGGRKTLRANCVDNGIPAIVPELGGFSQFDEEIVTIAYNGVRNIMINLGIIEGDMVIPEKQVKLEWLAEMKKFYVYAKKGGIFVPEVKLGDVVKKDERIGVIYSPRTFEVLDELKAPQDGYIFTIREDPVAHIGDPLISVPKLLERIKN
jgi:predicted deacylase